MNDFYQASVNNSLPRLMGLLDRNPISNTFGCFDRSFWHYRRTDFASSAAQQGILIIASLLNESKQIELGGANYLYELIQAIIKYTLELQHSDGSLDEWYPQERGWAGPTGYVLYALAYSAELLGDKIEPNLKIRLSEFSLKAIDHLLNYEEADVLSNHQVMALLAIETAQKVFSLNCNQAKKKELENRIYCSFVDKQWSLEYDGCDPGYQTATLSFMARLHRVTQDAKLEVYAEEQLKFLKQFVFPDGSFGGPMGTRGTANLFVFGFEYWTRQFPEHSDTLNLLRSGLRAGQFSGPSELDDHYFIYRLAEYVETAKLKELIPEKSAEWSSDKITNYDQLSGILKISNEKQYGILNLKKGGAGKIYSLNGNQNAYFSDGGYFLEDTCGKKYTTAFVHELTEINTSIQNQIKIKTFGVIYKRPVFTVFTFWIFRFFLFFVRSPRLALWTKTIIRKAIMVKFKQVTGISLEREIRISETISILDRININGLKIKKCIRAFEFPARSVPQSLHATAYTATRNQYAAFTDQDLAELNFSGSLEKKVF